MKKIPKFSLCNNKKIKISKKEKQNKLFIQKKDTMVFMNLSSSNETEADTSSNSFDSNL